MLFHSSFGVYYFHRESPNHPMDNAKHWQLVDTPVRRAWISWVFDANAVGYLTLVVILLAIYTIRENHIVLSLPHIVQHINKEDISVYTIVQRNTCPVIQGSSIQTFIKKLFKLSLIPWCQTSDTIWQSHNIWMIDANIATNQKQVTICHVMVKPLSVCKQTTMNNFPHETPQTFRTKPLSNPPKRTFHHSIILVLYCIIDSSRRKGPIWIQSPNNQIITCKRTIYKYNTNAIKGFDHNQGCDRS